MSRDLLDQLAEYGEHVRAAHRPIELSELDRTTGPPVTRLVNGRQITVLSRSDRPMSTRRRWLKGSAAAATLVLVVVGLALLRSDATDQAGPPVAPGEAPRPVIPLDALDDARAGPDRAAPTTETPLPDFTEVNLADSSGRPVVLASADELPNSDRLDFLQTECGDGPCFRDARFVYRDGQRPETGDWAANRPFHIRHGFPNDTGQPLGEGFDLAIYTYPLQIDSSGLDRDPLGPTQRYTTDAIVRAEADACGPSYRSQAGPVMCEWFVHDFPNGLPEGRWAIWAVWEAPCRAWVDLGLAESCTDASEVMSYFSSGVDSPFYSIESGPGPGEGEVANPLVGMQSTLTNRTHDVLFRVSADEAAYWRITTLPQYDGLTFHLPERPLERLDDEPAVEGEAGPDTAGGSIVRQRIEIAALGGQLVPAAGVPIEGDGASDGTPIRLRIDRDTSTLLASESLEAGDGFTIVSAMPQLEPDQLRAATTSDPPDPIYVDLPDGIPAVISELAEDVTSDATTPYDAAVLLEQWFRNEFEYSLDVRPGHSVAALEAFVADGTGYAEQFAATFVVMARTLDIPSRVAIGYTPGVLDEDGWYRVTGADAHAWPEIWFDDIGWVRFEPTLDQGGSDAER